MISGQWFYRFLKKWPKMSQIIHNSTKNRGSTPIFVCLFVFNVPSTARSFRDGTPIYCPLRRTWSSVNTPSRPGIEPGAVAWQFITLPLLHTPILTILVGVHPRNIHTKFESNPCSSLREVEKQKFKPAKDRG